LLLSLKTVGVAVGAALGVALAAGAYKAAGALAGLAKSSVAAASTMDEATNKVRVVFGDAAASIEEFSEDASQSLLISTQAALAAAGTFGNLFTAMGIGQKPAADMSKTMLQLAADLASFNDIEVDEALIKLRAGLVGEAEPLRQLGVNLTAVTIKAKAMELGLFDGVGALSAAAKAQGAYALIMEQTTVAQGDAARTAGGLANQQRQLGAQVDTLKAKFGESLLPVVTKITTALTGMIEQNGEQWARDFASGVDTLAEAMTAAASAAGKLWGALDALNNVGPGKSMIATLKDALTLSAGPDLAKTIMEGFESAMASSGVSGDAFWGPSGGPGDQLRRGLGIGTGTGQGEDDAGNIAGWTPPWVTAAGGVSGVENVGNIAKDKLKKIKEDVDEWAREMQSIMGGFLSDQVEAYREKGEEGYVEVKASQDKMLQQAIAVAFEMHNAFGVSLPDALRSAMASVTLSAEEMARAAEAAAERTLSAIEQLWRAAGGDQNAGAAGNLMQLALAAEAGVSGGTSAANAILGGGANYGTINNVYPNVSGGTITAPSTASGMVG